ncbi:NAD(P)-binding protein [Penicillium herquei]|nr:NAD(P)-binding protein [Penicillium herquei]
MSSPLVFITGATGFIGAQVVATTLQAGYRVRLSIRKAAQEAIIRARYAGYNGHEGIEFTVIPDLSKQESFSSALAGVDYVFHLASPTPDSGDIQTSYIDPAVEGTLSILRAAKAFEQIKKIVVVSSLLALGPVDTIFKHEVSLRDNTGETIPIDVSMALPDGFAGEILKYSASKIKAHEATREFIKNNAISYKLIIFHPTFVLGDSLLREGPEDISGINAIFWRNLFEEKPTIHHSWVHVRDVADAHVKALETEIESGKEFILARPVDWEDVVSHVNEKYPELGCKMKGPFEDNWKIDTTTAEEILGMKWRSGYSIIDDLIQQQLALQAKAGSS